jgi:hypothetical protein
MRKLFALCLLFLMVMPVVLGYIYMKPEDIKFREGGPQRYNEYFYDPRVQTFRIDTWVYLTPPNPPIYATGQPAIYPRGTVRLQSRRSPYIPFGAVTLNVKDLRPSEMDNTYYQAWLYDSVSGQYLNLGLFETIGGGVGEIEMPQMTNYFDPYEMVVVTREPRDDKDPRPSTDVVLMGKIMKQSYFVPSPILGEKQQTGYSYERQ